MLRVSDAPHDLNDDSATLDRPTTNMKPLDWVEFTWNMAIAPPTLEELPEHYHIEAAAAADEDEMRKVVARALTLDPTWSADLDRVVGVVDEWVTRAFAGGHPIALRHGQRIIGCVIVSEDAAAPGNLAPGPCVSIEYRNRGFGSHLLAFALQYLRGRGLTHAVGITRASANAARSLYAKFGGVAEVAAERSLAA